MHHWFDLILLNKISILKKVGFSGFVTSYIKSWIRQWNCRLGPNSNARNMIVTYLIPKVTMRIVLMPHIARVDAMIWARRTLSLPPHINLCITKLLTIAPSKLVNNCCNKQRLFYEAVIKLIIILGERHYKMNQNFNLCLIFHRWANFGFKLQILP